MDKRVKERLTTQQDPRMHTAGRSEPRSARLRNRPDPRMTSARTPQQTERAEEPSEDRDCEAALEMFDQDLKQLKRNTEAETSEIRRLLDEVRGLANNTAARVDELDRSLGVKSGTMLETTPGPELASRGTTEPASKPSGKG